MLDKNVVILEGYAGDDVMFGKSVNATDYCSFSLAINSFSKELGDSDRRTKSQQYIRIMVFNNPKTKLVDYLKDAGFKRGMRVSVFGMLASRRNEYKGIDFIQNNVVVRDITIIKNKNE